MNQTQAEQCPGSLQAWNSGNCQHCPEKAKNWGPKPGPTAPYHGRKIVNGIKETTRQAAKKSFMGVLDGSPQAMYEQAVRQALTYMGEIHLTPGQVRLMEYLRGGNEPTVSADGIVQDVGDGDAVAEGPQGAGGLTGRIDRGPRDIFGGDLIGPILP